MGWDYYCDPSHDREWMINKIKSRSFWASHAEPLSVRVVGNNVWCLMRDTDAGKNSIVLVMIKSGGRGYGYGYKSIGEESGPHSYDCPLSMLDAADPIESEWAIEWRQKVRQYHAAKKNRPKPESGRVITYGDQTFRLDRPLAPRRGWCVTNTATGALYRMSAKQLAHATYH